MAQSSSARKLIPKRLEEDLGNIPRYKAVLGAKEPPTTKDVFDDSIERAMYDQILGPMINRPRTSGSVLGSLGSLGLGQPRPSSSQQSAPSSSDSSSFSASLLSRLSLVEGDNKDLRRQLAEKVLRIDQLERDNRRLKAQVEASSSATSTKVFDLLTELETAQAYGADLESQVEEMEKFLGDYGLMWVGSQQQQASGTGFGIGAGQQQQQQQQQATPASLTGQPSPSKPTAPPAGVNFHDFSTKVQELNRTFSSEPTQIRIQARTARFQHASEAVEHIPVAFYRNGLLIRRGPFRENGSPGYDSFVRDVMDGYFPGEFRREFPEGVMLDVRDRHAEDWRAGGRDDLQQRMSGSQLLRRLPQSVIRNGEVVTMRDEVDRLLVGRGGGTDGASEGYSYSSEGGGSGSLAASGAPKKAAVVVLATPAASATSPGLVTFVTVQVRWVDGTMLQAKMFPGDTVGDVREYVTRHFTANAGLGSGPGSGSRNSPKSSNSSSSLSVTSDPTISVAVAVASTVAAVAASGGEVPLFELRTAHPPRKLENYQTLEEAGLSPGGGVVHARRL